MLFSEIKPYIRFARYLILNNESEYSKVYPLDARFLYTQKGEGEIEVGGEVYKMKAGSALYINSGVKYHLKTPEKSVTYLAVNFDFTCARRDVNYPVPPCNEKEFSEDKILENVNFSDATEFNSHMYVEDLRNSENDMISINKEYYKKIIYYENAISAKFTNILIKLARQIKAENVFDGNKETVEKIVDFIRENYKMSLSNKVIGEYFNFHPNYISSMIKIYTGMPLHKYLTHIKIANASNLLNTSDLTVGEIAAECGFCDIGHFSKTFKKITGVSPVSYKKLK